MTHTGRTGRPVLPVAARKAEPTGKVRVSAYLERADVLKLDAFARHTHTTRGRALAHLASLADRIEVTVGRAGGQGEEASGV